MVINSYCRFLQTIQDKSIVIFGAGKIFNSCKYILEEKPLRDKILAVVDNDTRKHGTEINVQGKCFSVINFEELTDVCTGRAFLILVTTACFDEIQRQISGCEKLRDIEVLDARDVLQKRESYLASYSNIFPGMRTETGENGENMSISVLTHNRVELTVKLLESIQQFMPQFKGEVLIGDNGSDEKERTALEDTLKHMRFDYRLLKFDRHYPITAGKNKLHRECRKKWILQLDNDVYFTGNPIQKINEDISALGCRLWGLPYYDAWTGKVANYGSNLEIRLDENGEKYLVCRLDLPFCEKEAQWPPILCTYSSGAATLMEKDFFMEMGMYDENLFMHQDVEFLYRANLRGYKIGNIGMNCLVHDHKQIDSESGRRYEAIRFDEERLKKSRQYLKEKYGLGSRL